MALIIEHSHVERKKKKKYVRLNLTDRIRQFQWKHSLYKVEKPFEEL